mgnify:FL=1|jgi:hypothetical protein
MTAGNKYQNDFWIYGTSVVTKCTECNFNFFVKPGLQFDGKKLVPVNCPKCHKNTALPVLKGAAIGKAVTYAKNQKPYMENYLLDGRCALSNNAAENAICPFTVGRKNWLFADTPKGADASAMVYNLVETAKTNGINIYAYLQYLLINTADGDWHN